MRIGYRNLDSDTHEEVDKDEEKPQGQAEENVELDSTWRIEELFTRCTSTHLVLAKRVSWNRAADSSTARFIGFGW